jgi:hypothetical protein
MGIMIDRITKEDFEFYKKWEEKKYASPQCNYNIGDIVVINAKIKYNEGYAGERGVVIAYAGVNYYYVFAFNRRAHRYWSCGFEEKDLTPVRERITFPGPRQNRWSHPAPRHRYGRTADRDDELCCEALNWILQEYFHICTEEFETAYYATVGHKAESYKGKILNWLRDIETMNDKIRQHEAGIIDLQDRIKEKREKISQALDEIKR